MNTLPHSSMTPSHHVEFRRFGSHLLSSPSRNKARIFSKHLISANLTSLQSTESYEALMLTSVYIHLLTAADQHGFRPGHSTTSALLQLTSNIATGFNQRKPPHRTICIAVDLTAVFDTVNHNVLLSKSARSTLPEATCRWLSNYIRDRPLVTSCKGVKSKARIVHTGVPQGSNLSPSLFSFYFF